MPLSELFHTLFDPIQSFTNEGRSSIIAVTGLGGRPFGSWQCIDDGSMWLQDAVPRAIPTARVLIYGYESKTVGFDSHATLNDFGDHFLQSLITSRGSLMETVSERDFSSEAVTLTTASITFCCIVRLTECNNSRDLSFLLDIV